MKKYLFVIVLSVMISLSLFSGGFSTESFLPITQGGTTEVEGQVQQLDEETLKTDTLQDGLNEANQLIWKETDGFRAVQFPSGTGYLAGATAVYGVYPNINATLLAKRAAYLEAYYMAQVHMLEALKGYYSEKKDEFQNLVASIDDEVKNGGLFFKIQTETIDQVVNGLLRGFVTYDVKDNPKETTGTIYVSIAISPSTIKAANQITNGIIFSVDLQSTLNHILSEIENGVTPPIGGKIIVLPDNNMTAVVAFGSAIVRYSNNPILAAEYKKAAIQASKMRASQALVDLLKGNSIIYSSGFYEGSEAKTVEEFDEANAKIKQYNQQNENFNVSAAETVAGEFMNVFGKTSAYKAVSSGNIPAGTILRTAIDESVEVNGYGWVYAVAVYYPELALDGGSLYNKLMDTSYGVTNTPNISGTNMGNTTENEQIVGSPLSDNPQGPSGKVSDDDDL